MNGFLSLPTYHIHRAQLSQQRSLERISSGKRVVRASDDPSGFAVAENLSTRARSARIAQRNVSDGIALMQTVDGAAGEVAELLKRLRELATQGASETLGDTERAYLDRERQQLTEEVDRVAYTTDLFGRTWTDGSAGGVSVQAGPDPGDTITLSPGDLRAATLGIDTLDFSTSSGAGAALPALDAALDAIHSQRSQTGASMNRLESAERLAQTSEFTHIEAASRIVDVDIALEVAEMVKAQIRMQTSIAAFMKINEANRTMMSALLG